MKYERVIKRKVRRQRDGVDIASDVNAVFSVNVGKGRSHTGVTSRQTARADDDDPGKEVKEDE